MTPLLDIAQQPLQRRPLHGAAGETAVVVAVADEDPALVLLAGDVGQRRLALGVERVELHVEPLVGRDAGVDGAADLADGRFHFAEWFRSPKNSGPFHRVPVMARAMADSDLYLPALVLEAVVEHGGAVLDALPFADQPGAGDRAVTLAHRLLALDPPVLLLDQLLQLRLGPRRQPAVGQFLDAGTRDA